MSELELLQQIAFSLRGIHLCAIILEIGVFIGLFLYARRKS